MKLSQLRVFVAGYLREYVKRKLQIASRRLLIPETSLAYLATHSTFILISMECIHIHVAPWEILAWSQCERGWMMMGHGYWKWRQKLEKKSFPTPLPVNYCDFHRFTTLGVEDFHFYCIFFAYWEMGGGCVVKEMGSSRDMSDKTLATEAKACEYANIFIIQFNSVHSRLFLFFVFPHSESSFLGAADFSSCWLKQWK